MKNQSNKLSRLDGSLQPLRTLIVDDSATFLSCLRGLLEAQPLVQVIGTAADGIQALSYAYALAADLVLMDLQMPGMDGLEATALLRSRLPNIRIIIVTLDDTIGNRAAARAHGAHGFVGKSRIIADLMTEIGRVFRLKYADDEGGNS